MGIANLYVSGIFAVKLSETYASQKQKKRNETVPTQHKQNLYDEMMKAKLYEHSPTLFESLTSGI